MVEAVIESFVDSQPLMDGKLNFAPWRHAVVSAQETPEAALNVLYAAAAVLAEKGPDRRPYPEIQLYLDVTYTLVGACGYCGMACTYLLSCCGLCSTII
jgi:hypothetical protein